MLESKASSEFLHFGQLVLVCLEEDSYLFSKGFIDNSINVQEFDEGSSSDFSGAVFRVLPQCMHSVQNDLLVALDELSQAQFHEKFSRHEESLEGEIKTNIQTYSNFKGEAVKFGSLIQLQHVLSYKFITLVPQENAEIDKENLRITLTEFASECSYLRIEPGYKFQKETDGLVRMNDRVIFEVTMPDLIKSVFFNVSEHSTAVKSELLPGDVVRREVNASLDHKVRWKLKQYSKYIPEKENALLCGDHIWITHSEHESCIVANSHKQENMVYFHSNMNDTNGLWKIEAENIREGGNVTSEKLYRLRHASSGLYLSVDQEQGKIKSLQSFTSALASKMAKTTVFIIGLGRRKNPYNLWKLQPLHNNKKPRKIFRDDLCVLINNETAYSLHGVANTMVDKDNLEPIMKSETSEEAYFKVFKCDDSMTWGTLFLLDCMPILTEFPAFIEKHSQLKIQHDNLLLIREFNKVTGFITNCLDNLLLFCKNKLKSMITIDKQFGQVEAQRQKILREQLFIDALAEILSTMFVNNYSLSRVLALGKLDIIESEKTPRKSKDISAEISRSHLHMVSAIGRKIYTLISVICKGNKQNQHYSFKYVKTFQKHAAYGLGATSTLITILDNNESLLLQLHKPQGISSDHNSDSLISHYAWLLRVTPT